MNEILIDENVLNIGRTKITTKYPIKKIEKMKEKYIVLLKIPHIASVLPSGAYMLAIEKIIIKQQGFTDIATNMMVIEMYFILAFF